VHEQAEAVALGQALDKYYGWHYPPIFLFAAAALALLPYVPSLLIWLAVTLAAYVAAIRAIIGHRAGVLLASGFPGVIWNFSAGQNGFLTAALIGGSLLLIERRPLVAGVLIGLLSYKPQFGLLFPLVLALDRRWQTFGAAALTALALAAASWIAFGAESWRAFVEWMPVTGSAVFVEGRAGLFKLQSLFGLVRWLGGGNTLAWALQGALIAALAVVVGVVWRRPIPFELKAAALAAGALLATPYLYIYDLAALAVPIAFLMRIGLRDGFLPGELAGLAAACLLVLLFPALDAPSGLFAVALVALLVGRRVWRVGASKDGTEKMDNNLQREPSTAAIRARAVRSREIAR
jgi:hypothetical protein